LNHASYGPYNPVWDPTLTISPGGPGSIVDASGNYYPDGSGYKLIPTDFLVELCPLKCEVVGGEQVGFVDSDGLPITDVPFFAPYNYTMDASNILHDEYGNVVDTSGKYIPGSPGRYVLDTSEHYWWVGVTAQGSPTEQVFQLPKAAQYNNFPLISTGLYDGLAYNGVLSTAMSPVNYGYGYMFDNTGVMDYSDFNPAYISANINDGSGFATTGLNIKNMRKILSAAGYVGETCQFRFFRSDDIEQSVNIVHIETVNHVLEYSNNAVYCNVPARNTQVMKYAGAQNEYHGGNVWKYNSPNAILLYLEYQQSENIPIGYLYGKDSSGNSISMLQHIKGCTVTTPGDNPNFDTSGNYTVTFDDSGCQFAYNQYMLKFNQLLTSGVLGNTSATMYTNLGYIMRDLGPYVREFANAYFDAYPEFIPEHPYITSNDYIPAGNSINVFSGFFAGPTDLRVVHGPATPL
jgi:hypothetical protein